MQKTNYVVVIDTNKYSGNFERDITAWITGFVNECGVGTEYIGEDTNPLYDSIREKISPEFDERYQDDIFCKIWTTPGRFNDGMGHHADGEPDLKEKRYPAYESVGIFFGEKPTEEDLLYMKEKAKSFPKDIEIKGIRLIEKQTKSEEKELMSL